jgi:nitroreductase
MDFQTLVKSRYSFRSYNDSRPVEKEKLLRILEAGRMAPSAANRQPWTFIVVQTKALLEQIHQCYPATWFKEAPVILVVKGNKKDAWTRRSDGYNALETDLTIAMDHMILAATEEGLASCWIAAFDPTKLQKALKLQEDEVVYAITPLGYAGDDLSAKRLKSRKPLADIVEWA